MPSWRRGKILGRGENATVFAVKNHPELALKEFKDSSSYAQEVRMLSRMGRAAVLRHVAYTVHDSGKSRRYPQGFIVMERLLPLTREDVHRHAVQVKIATMITHLAERGIVHNDLHWGNVMMRLDRRSPVFVDFEYGATLSRPRADVDVMALALGQVYQLLDPYNENNKAIFLKGLRDGPLVDYVYRLRQQMRREEVARRKF